VAFTELLEALVSAPSVQAKDANNGLFDRTCLALMLVYRDILMHASLHPSQNLHKPPTGANITSGFWNIPVRLMVGEKTAGRPITKD